MNSMESLAADSSVNPLHRGPGMYFVGRNFEVIIERLDVHLDAINDFASILVKSELQRSQRFVFERDCHRFIVGRARLRCLLSRRLGVSPRAIELIYGAHGKPALAPSFAASDLHFNVSHSKNLVVYAFAFGRDIGVDVEAVRPIADADDIAARFFSDREKLAYFALEPRDRLLGFFNCWTRKEAFVKALGDGFYYPLDHFDVSLVPGELPRIDRVGNMPGDRRGWQLSSFAPIPGYVGAVVIESSTRQEDCTVSSPPSHCSMVAS